MKTIEELKKEQREAKEKLHELIELINSKEYFNLSPREKGLISQQRAGMEIYMNSLSNRLYNSEDYSFDMSASMMMPLLMSSFMNGPSFSSSISDTYYEKTKENNNIVLENED